MYTAIARRRLVSTLRHLEPTFGSPLTSHSSLQTRQAHSAIPDTSRTHESEKPISRPTGHIQLDTAPCWTLRDDPIPDKIQARIRTNGRELLPFNNGRPIAPDGSQKITPVGHPTPAQQSSGKKTPKLFEPLTIRNRPFLKNRIVVSPMCMYSCDDGFMNDFHLVHIGRFAVGGAGMVIFEATSVAFEGRISPTDSGLWKDEQMEPLKRIVQFLRSQDCVAGIQLAHAGRKASTLPPFQVPRKPAVVGDGVQADLGGWPEAVKGPSSIAFADDFIVPNEMTTQEIKQVVQQFIDSAKRAEACGFKFIEVHAAHGYLLTSFMCASSNKRTDEYGGSFDNRLRFLREVVEGVRAAVSRDIPIGVRLTCEEWIEQGWHMEDTLKCVDQLQRLGVDIIDCSSGGNNLAQKIKVGPGYQVPFARGVKKAYPNLTTGAVGIITDPKQAEKILQDGEADFVLLARQMLRDPQWALHAAKELDYDITWAPQFHYLGLSRR